MSTDTRTDQTNNRSLNRRTLIKTGLGALAAPAILNVIPVNAQSRVIKIGHVSPRTGPIAPFGEADPFILDQVQKRRQRASSAAARTYPVQIISKDSQSSDFARVRGRVRTDPARQGRSDRGASTPDTTNPVADQAEVNEVPCVTTDCPWQPYFFGRNGDPGQGLHLDLSFLLGPRGRDRRVPGAVERRADQQGRGRAVPERCRRQCLGRCRARPAAAARAAGYKLIDPGRYQPVNNDFTSQISAFKTAGAEIVTGNMIPPDFATFWSQAAQQGFRPKIVTIGKALLFPSVINSLGARGNGLTTEIWWTPNHPFKSGLTGQSARELTDAYTRATNRPWTQPIGFKHALFEVAIDVLKRAKNSAIRSRSSMRSSPPNYNSIVGPVQLERPAGEERHQDAAGLRPVAAQGRCLRSRHHHNETAPNIPVGGKLELLS